MKYEYTHFIPENVAPKGAKRIGVYQGDKRICTVPLGRLAPVEREPLYSFGLMSDIHLGRVNIEVYGYSWNKFDNALAYFKNNGCSFCVVCGDLTVTGLYYSPDDTPANAVLEETQFAKYKEICDKHGLPVYELMGNHESYYGKPIENNMSLMTKYTGNNTLSYIMKRENDVFVFCGQNRDSSVMSDDDYAWLTTALESNKDSRCFVFIHPYMEEDSGDAMDVRENSIFDYWGAIKTTAFKNLMKRYPNVVLFHGHSHMKLGCQEFDENANYTERNGFKSVHVPSLAIPRDVQFTYTKDGVTTTTLAPDTSGTLGTLTKTAAKDDRSASQGYIVNVYDDCIVLRGMDMTNQKQLAIATYKLMT